MIFQIQSFRQAAFWATAINAFSQGLALVFSMVMAAVFGAQESTDIVYYCLGVFALLAGISQSASVGVLIPETMRRRHQTGDLDAMAFINRFLVLMGIPIVVLAGILLWKPISALALVSRFSPEALSNHSRLLVWLFLSLPLQIIADLLLNILVSYRFLALPATLSCLSRSINILFACLFHRKWGVEALAMGLAVGYAFQVGVNLLLLVRVIGWRFTVWRTRVGRNTFRNLAWVEVGTMAVILSSYLPLFLFSGFGAGALTALNYARRMCAMPAELLGSQISSVAAIKLNEQAALNDLGGMACSFDRIQRLLILTLTPLAVVLALTGIPLVQILFGRGAFGAAAVNDTAWLFSLLILTLPLEALNSVVARVNIARQEVAFGTKWQIYGNVLNAALVYGFVHQMGAMGFPVGTFVYFVVYLTAFARPFSRKMPPLILFPTLKRLGRTMAGCGVAAAVAWSAFQWLLPLLRGPWIQGGVLPGLFCIVYVGVLRYVPPDREGRDEGIALLRAAIRHMSSKLKLREC